MNRSKAKGTRFESDVVAYLREHGFRYAERRALAGNADRGDIAGVPGVAIECKAVQRIELATFVDESQREAANAGAGLGVTVVKRRQKSTGDAYVVMPLSAFVALIRDDEVDDPLAT